MWKSEDVPPVRLTLLERPRRVETQKNNDMDTIKGDTLERKEVATL